MDDERVYGADAVEITEVKRESEESGVE